MPAEEQPVAKTWNGLIGRLEQFFKDAIDLAETKPYKDDPYIRGYKDGLKLALDIVKGLRIDESRLGPVEEYH